MTYNLSFSVSSWADILAPLDDLIDWTVSFRQDSTIYRPYCYSISQETHLADFINNYTARFRPETNHQKIRQTESRFDPQISIF